MITARADVVGSLLRPGELLLAREELGASRISPAEFRGPVEDDGEWSGVGLVEGGIDQEPLPVASDQVIVLPLIRGDPDLERPTRPAAL